jgi:hypothetical protein
MFAETDDNAKVSRAKWDIKEGFWHMDCTKGEEWNFAYVLPQLEEAPKHLVIPTSLHMGWVESPPYFCAVTETVRYIATEYINTPVALLPHHKFTKYVIGDQDSMCSQSPWNRVRVLCIWGRCTSTTS